MLTMAPPPCSRITGAAALVQRKGPVRLTASTRFQSSSEVSSSGANTATPALLTSASSRPKRMLTADYRGRHRRASATSQCSASVWSGVVQRRHRAAQQFALDIEQRHAPAFGEKFFRNRKPDAARGAGHQRDFLDFRGHPDPFLYLFKRCYSALVCIVSRTRCSHGDAKHRLASRYSSRSRDRTRRSRHCRLDPAIHPLRRVLRR